jgi:hypothetical protein
MRMSFGPSLVARSVYSAPNGFLRQPGVPCNLGDTQALRQSGQRVMVMVFGVRHVRNVRPIRDDHRELDGHQRPYRTGNYLHKDVLCDERHGVSVTCVSVTCANFDRRSAISASRPSATC